MKSKPTFNEPENGPSSDVAAGRRPVFGLSLVYYPSPILRAICRPVDHFDSTLQDLVEEMHSLIEHHAGIGLAGPQVAVEKRLLVCAIQGRKLSLANPDIQAAGEPGELVEGCLSLPDVQVRVTRPERIQVTGYDTRGRKIRFGATGLWARVIQHEIDHLNGVLICDRGRPPGRSCSPCSLSLPAVLVEERKYRSKRAGQAR